jgi:imidazolonepropionase-like amidohydrolase
VLEGGVDLWQDLEAVVDGFGAVEHNLPVAPLHADVRALFAGAVAGGRVGTFYTPTLLVAYGGLTGQHGFWVDDNPLDDPRMLRHWPVRELQAMSWRRPMYALDTELNHEVVAREAAALARLGVPVTLGAHGALQGLGVHWELWSLAASGAMTPHEALRAGTATGARYLGLEDRIGTVAAGYLADLVIVDGDPLEDIRRSDDIFMVVKNGGIWR